MKKDIRSLCPRCREDYRTAGYNVRIVHPFREPCDKCERMGAICEIKRGGDRAEKYRLDKDT